MARPIDTKAAARRISAHVSGLGRDLETLIRGLRSEVLRASSKSVALAKSQPGRRRRFTAKDRSRLKLQGEYLGLMRHLPKAHHARIKKVRQAQGYRPAIRLARRLSK